MVSINFLLSNFEEMNKLWTRMARQGGPASSDDRNERQRQVCPSCRRSSTRRPRLQDRGFRRPGRMTKTRISARESCVHCAIVSASFCVISASSLEIFARSWKLAASCCQGVGSLDSSRAPPAPVCSLVYVGRVRLACHRVLVKQRPSTIQGCWHGPDSRAGFTYPSHGSWRDSAGDP